MCQIHKNLLLTHKSKETALTSYVWRCLDMGTSKSFSAKLGFAHLIARSPQECAHSLFGMFIQYEIETEGHVGGVSVSRRRLLVHQ